MPFDFKIIGQLKGLKKKYQDIDEKLDRIILILQQVSKPAIEPDKIIKNDGRIFKQINGRNSTFIEGIGWTDIETGQKVIYDQKGNVVNNFLK